MGNLGHRPGGRGQRCLRRLVDEIDAVDIAAQIHHIGRIDEAVKIAVDQCHVRRGAAVGGKAVEAGCQLGAGIGVDHIDFSALGAAARGRRSVLVLATVVTAADHEHRIVAAVITLDLGHVRRGPGLADAGEFRANAASIPAVDVIGQIGATHAPFEGGSGWIGDIEGINHAPAAPHGGEDPHLRRRVVGRRLVETRGAVEEVVLLPR